jgi:hypothetical protein
VHEAIISFERSQFLKDHLKRRAFLAIWNQLELVHPKTEDLQRVLGFKVDEKIRRLER